MKTNAAGRSGPYCISTRAIASSARVVLSLGLLVVVASRAAAPQDTTRVAADSATLDSLRQRLERAEEAIDLLREQLATQAGSAVQSASRVQLDIFGRVLMNAFANSARVNNADVPLFVVPGATRGAGGSIRQSSLGLALTVPRVLDATFSGDLHLDFFGGQQPSSGGRNFPLVRMRTARGILRWARGELLFGQESPLVSGVSPVSVASFGTPGFTAAGNLWLWLPQLRATAELGTALRLAIQGAVLAPTSGDPAGAFDTEPDAAEQSRRPYLQARVRARWGSEEHQGEIGVGAHRGWLRRADNSLLASEAFTIDAIVPLGALLQLRGEGYRGQALRGLGGGGIGQGITTTGAPVKDRGGWAQLNLRASSRLELGTGCGVADPDDENLPAQRLRNSECEGHVTLHPGGPVLLSLAYRRHETKYAAETLKNDHINVGLGFEF
jgi:hypothetical protein